MKKCAPDKMAGRLDKEVRKLIRDRVSKELPIRVKEQVCE
jgi:hypothetical protein